MTIPDLTNTKHMPSVLHSIRMLRHHENGIFPDGMTHLFTSRRTNIEWSLVEDGKHLIVIIPGTNDLTDWFFNTQRLPIRTGGMLNFTAQAAGESDNAALETLFVAYAEQGTVQPHASEPKSEEWADHRIHLGFWQMYNDIKDELREVIAVACHDFDYPLVVTGHSLGAAMCTLAALDFQHNHYRENVYAYLYGSPRTGNRPFARSYRKHLGETTARVVNSFDLVPLLPTIGFAHITPPFHIGPPRWRRFIPRVTDHFITPYMIVLEQMAALEADRR